MCWLIIKISYFAKGYFFLCLLSEIHFETWSLCITVFVHLWILGTCFLWVRYLFTVYMTLVHCIYDTCSLCLLEVFTSLVDGQGGTDLEWLGIVPIPSPHFGERKERATERRLDRGVYWAKIVYIWRKRDYGRRGKMRQCFIIGEFNIDCVLWGRGECKCRGILCVMGKKREGGGGEKIKIGMFIYIEYTNFLVTVLWKEIF